MTFAASPSHLREAPGMSSTPTPHPQHPQPFPTPLELGRLLSQAPERQLSGRGRALGNTARRELSPAPNKPARSLAAPSPSWGNPAGLGLAAAVQFGESPGWEEKREPGVRGVSAGCSLSAAPSCPGEPVRLFVQCQGISALSAGEKPCCCSTCRHMALNGPIWERQKRVAGRLSSRKGEECFPSHPSAFLGHPPPRSPWKSDAPDGRSLCGMR